MLDQQEQAQQAPRALPVTGSSSPALVTAPARAHALSPQVKLDATHGEIKSMRTARTHLRRGVASIILERILGEAHRRLYRRLSIETGAQDAFAPARALYRRFGFVMCDPFADYRPDPNSVFMTKRL